MGVPVILPVRFKGYDHFIVFKALLGDRVLFVDPAFGNLTATVRAFREYLPAEIPLPHPSWRSRLWIRNNPWFESELLPVLRERLRSTSENG